MDYDNCAPPQIIADTYQIIRRIGSGGGGIVYLAQHLRLNKKVVLKADKRDLSTSPEVLRREVDALKDMSHTYIPQVYDFIVDGGTVYTVMDYIEGESLDKPLKRGERFPQVQVIEWACQLLEALVYLHSRPPHGILHADIKPANVMVTPQGDIRLIDFNIALALGAEGAVAVGHSFGYASPEHYGLSFLPEGARTVSQADAATDLSDKSVSYIRTVLDGNVNQRDSTSSGRKILLDVRSDVYSLGATLYHLLTGIKPAKDVREIVPIQPMMGVSQAVVDIINKAMMPEPENRYQTAAEMLYAFEHLHEADYRTKRYKLVRNIVAVVLAATFLTGGGMAFTGLKQMEQAQAEAAQAAREAEAAARQAEEAERLAKETEQQAKQALSAVRDSEQRYQAGDIPGAVQSALKGLAVQTPYQAQAQKALTDALGTYDLSDGFRPHLLLDLPGEPLKAVLSPEGTRVAVRAKDAFLIYDTGDGARLAQLPAEPSALSDIVFSGEDAVIYAGQGGIRAYSLIEQRELWSGGAATGLSLSADGSTVAAVNRDAANAAVYHAETGEKLRDIDFYGLVQRVVANDIFVDPGDALFSLNGDGTLLAASFSNGALWVFDLGDGKNDIELYDQSEFTHFEGGFSGPYFAFSASDGSGSTLAVIDTVNLVQTGGLEAGMDIHVQADESGIYVTAGRLVTALDPVSFEESERAYASFATDNVKAFSVGTAHTVLATETGGLGVFDAVAGLLGVWQTGQRYDLVDTAGDYVIAGSWDTPALQVLKREAHPEAQLFSYDGDTPHSEARISADGTVAMLFRHDAFQLYQKDGTLLVEQSIPDADQVYDQQYRRSEGYLEVIYNDGLVRRYSVLDGRLLSEEKGEKPDKTMYEEFLTDKLRITSPLHGMPAAYDRESGTLIRELEKDAYLTYVTQVDEYIITQYVSAQGERYGLLLNGDCETLAKLPGLCDILEDGTLVFDDDRGNLRQCRIYSTQELIALGEKNRGGVQ